MEQGYSNQAALTFYKDFPVNHANIAGLIFPVDDFYFSKRRAEKRSAFRRMSLTSTVLFQ